MSARIVKLARFAIKSSHLPPVLALVALLGAGSIVQWSYVQSLLETEDTIATRIDLLAGLKHAVVRLRSASLTGSAKADQNAPFIAGETETIAAAAFQAYVLSIIEGQSATVYSTHIKSTTEDRSAANPSAISQTGRRIYLEVAFDTHIANLQQVLFKLETGSPTIIVDAADIQTQRVSEAAGSIEADPKLRVVLSLFGFWRST